MYKTILLIVWCALLSATSFAQNCSPVGTWYGGSEVKYQVTVTYNGMDKYTVIAEAGFQIPGGFPIVTRWTGVMVRQGQDFRTNSMMLLNSDTSFPPTPPQIWAVQATAEMPTCNTMSFTYYFFGGYFWGKAPLVDPPDYYPVPTPIYETYNRLVEP